ncbi:hypothetical protein MFKK_00170 [Halopseudomonas aestusnigri]|nr:hypothetical protein MFKK_00170 [Halopseudomonas aestusnigri]
MTLIPDPTYPQPLPLMPEASEPAPYPVHVLPTLLQDAARAIAHHVQAPEAIAGQCVIGVAAYLAQTRVNAPALNRLDGMPCSLFLLTLANSGDRKSECRRLAFRVIDDAEREARSAYRQQCKEIEDGAAHLKGKARDEYLAEHPLPSDPRTQYSDATFEPIAGDFIRGMPAACWDTDEGGQLFGGASLKADTRASTLGGLVKAFDSGTFERTRSRGNVEGSGVAYHRRLSVHLLAQAVTVAEALDDPLLQGQGFLPRFLFADAPSLAGTRFLTPERMHSSAFSDARLHRFWDRCRAIMATDAAIDAETGEVTPPTLQLTPAAEAVWREHYNATEAEQSTLGDLAGVRPFAGRAGELARRLAAVLACFEQCPEITDSIMQSACAIVRYSVGEWARYTEGERLSPELKQAAALLAWLVEKDWQSFDARQLQREGPQSVRRSAKARDRLLAVLVEHRYLLTSNGKQFQLNPAATTATPATTPATPSPGTCDTFATTCDKSEPADTLSQPVATLSQPSNPVNTGLVAGVANVATTSREKEQAALFEGEI